MLSYATSLPSAVRQLSSAQARQLHISVALLEHLRHPRLSRPPPSPQQPPRPHHPSVLPLITRVHRATAFDAVYLPTTSKSMKHQEELPRVRALLSKPVSTHVRLDHIVLQLTMTKLGWGAFFLRHLSLTIIQRCRLVSTHI
jgi:hypothetical protein